MGHAITTILFLAMKLMRDIFRRFQDGVLSLNTTAHSMYVIVELQMSA